MGIQKLTKEQALQLLSTIYFELQTIFEATTVLKKDKTSTKLSKDILSNLSQVLKNNGMPPGTDPVIHSIAD